MRSEKISECIDVILALHNSATGITYEDIKEITNNGSDQSAYRMVRTVRDFLGTELIETRDPLKYKVKRFRLPKRDLSWLLRFSPEELVELETAIELCRKSNHPTAPKALRQILDKIKAGLSNPRMVETDLEFLTRSKLAITPPGLRQEPDPAILTPLREALLAEQAIEIEYEKVYHNTRKRYVVHPYGLIYGKRNYLVAFVPTSKDIRHFALTHIQSIQDQSETFDRPADFDLNEHMSDSIGVFKEQPYNIVLRFAPEARADVMNFHFHPSQKFTPLDDGSVEVYLRAGGLRELCHHLFTWGQYVSIVKPAKMKNLYRDMLQECLADFD